jgi:hypothetical protein
MAKKTKVRNQCGICGQFMKLKRVIPKAHIFPELKTFQCGGCGNLRTVEEESELALPELAQVAA